MKIVHSSVLLLLLAMIIVLLQSKDNPSPGIDTEHRQGDLFLDKGLSVDPHSDPGDLLPSISQNSETPLASSLSPTDSADESATDLSKLPSSEQASLWKAFSEARREVRTIRDPWRDRSENVGYDFYALHPKQNLTTRFGVEGIQIVSSNRTHTEEDAANDTTAWQAQMRLRSFAGDEILGSSQPQKSDQSSTLLEYHHSSELTEWFDHGTEAIEHGYTIATRPANLKDGEEVALEVVLEGLEVAVQESDDESDSLVFVEEGREVLSYSKLLVVDAHGKHLPASMKPTSLGFSIAYNDASATYPVTVDPLIINEEAKLVAPDAMEGDFFGTSVSISGDTVVIGAAGDADGGDGSGSAYIFTHSGATWTLEAKLTASDAAANDIFGSTVAISGDTVVVGASRDDDGASESGSAYVFTRTGTTWSEEAKLIAFDAEAYDRFGSAVAISGDTVIVGAPYEEMPEWIDWFPDVGSAYVYVRTASTWSLQTKLSTFSSGAYGNFGSSVAISGDTVAIGAPGENIGDSFPGGYSAGAAYIYIRNGNAWSYQGYLQPDLPTYLGRFGQSVSISGDTAVVGASREGDDPFEPFSPFDDSGVASVYIRSGTNWLLQTKLKASDRAPNDGFGRSVGISGDNVIVGTYADDDGGSASGSAYFFTRSDATWSERAKLNASDHASEDYFGLSVAISGSTAVIGAAYDDDNGENSGGAYIFRLPRMLVFDSMDLPVPNNGSATALPPQLMDTSQSFTFRISNVDMQDLDIQSISLGGPDAEQFSLTLPDISSSVDLTENQSLDYTITISPVGASSGIRNASVTINSNDSYVPVFTFFISGLGLTSEADEDGDGLNDWAEYTYRNYGFDWQITQTDEVSLFYDTAPFTGLYVQDEIGAVDESVVVGEVDPSTNRATFILTWQESFDLNTYTKHYVNPAKLSVDGDGNIRYEVDATPQQKFYRAGLKR